MAVSSWQLLVLWLRQGDGTKQPFGVFRPNGCSSAVVVVVGALDARRNRKLRMLAASEFPTTVTSSSRDPESVAGAYLDILLAEPAACA